jgi:hypothetical protein
MKILPYCGLTSLSFALFGKCSHAILLQEMQTLVGLVLTAIAGKVLGGYSGSLPDYICITAVKYFAVKVETPMYVVHKILIL